MKSSSSGSFLICCLTSFFSTRLSSLTEIQIWNLVPIKTRSYLIIKYKPSNFITGLLEVLRKSFKFFNSNLAIRPLEDGRKSFIFSNSFKWEWSDGFWLLVPDTSGGFQSSISISVFISNSESIISNFCQTIDDCFFQVFLLFFLLKIKILRIATRNDRNARSCCSVFTIYASRRLHSVSRHYRHVSINLFSKNAT